MNARSRAFRPLRRSRILLRRLWRRRSVRRGTLLAGLAIGGFGSGVVYGSWSRACAGGGCPSIGRLEEYRPSQAAKVYAQDGRLITDLGEQRRTVLKVGDIAPLLRAAFLAVEDKRFYEHQGIDLLRVLGAVRANVLAFGWAEGFSTITMQLARNVWQGQIGFEKVLRRKIREMRVALELERTYSKDRIFELYLNQIYLGGNLYGVEAAAQAYFGKSARDVNPAEAALLAAVANLPGRYDPRRFPARAVARRNLVLNLMRDGEYLSPEEADRWKTVPALWIISTGRPEGALELGFEPASDWPRGFYRLAAPWRVFLVVRNELPRERATLILRATGSGRVLKEAIEDLLKEPENSRIRAILMRHLARLHLELRSHPSSRTPEEEEFAMTGEEMLRDLETKAREEGHKEGRKEGREEGREDARRMVRLAFEQRFGPIPSSLDEALGQIQDLGELERVMAACLSKPNDEIARILGVGVH